jgi:ATP-dependent RNA helicase RhlE
VALSFVLEKDAELLDATEALMRKKITGLDLPDDVEISEELTKEEMPVTRDKNLKKAKKLATPTGAFHEKKGKNKKEQLGGKRRQEKMRRLEDKYRKLRGF